MATHCFYSFGTRPRPALYRSEREFSCQRFVLPALLELGLVGDGVQYHGLVTDESLGEPSGMLADSILEVAGPGTRDAVTRTWDDPRYRVDARTTGLWPVVDRILEEVEDGDEVFLEITQGLRHVQVALLLAGGLLVSLRPSVKVSAVFYAELGAEGVEGAPADLVAQLDERFRAVTPIHDLGPLLTMFRWTGAVDALRRSLDTRPLAGLLADAGRHLGKTVAHDEVAKAEMDLVRTLKRLGPALALGWPREVAQVLRSAGEAAERVQAATSSALEDHALIPHKHAVRAALRDLGSLIGDAPEPEVLSVRRLQFDLRLVGALRDADRHGDALRILRELLVNAQLLADEAGAGWLEHARRTSAEAALHAAEHSERQARRDLGALWQSVSQARNAVSHAGMSEHLLKPTTIEDILRQGPAKLEELFEEGWQEAFRRDPDTSRVWLVNAFSLNMLAEPLSARVAVEPIALADARALAAEAESAVGHDSTALLFQSLLEREVSAARVNVAARSGDRLLVGQYWGPRLPAGATTLPEGAMVHWFEVKIHQRPPREEG